MSNRTLRKKKNKKRRSMDVWSGKGGNQEQNIKVLARLDAVKTKFYTLINAVAHKDKQDSHKTAVNNAIDTLKTEYNNIVTPAANESRSNTSADSAPVNNLPAAGTSGSNSQRGFEETKGE